MKHIKTFDSFLGTTLNEAYGDRRDYPKLHIFVNGEYLATTTWAKNKKEAKDNYLEKNPKTDPNTVEILTDAEWE
jgi:hypothetical protein